VIDGKILAARLRSDVADDAAAFAQQTGRPPGLAVVLVGSDAASAVYVRNKEQQSRAAGFDSRVVRLEAAISQVALCAVIEGLSCEATVDAVLLQLPLPPHLDAADALRRLDPAKDVDGLTIVNAGRLASGLPGLVPCTPLACMRLLEAAEARLSGARAVVLGRSNLMGKPMASLLLQADCTVTLAHSRSADLVELCREADILVAAVGRPGLVRGTWIKPGAIVIDVGINRVVAADGDASERPASRLVGDVVFEEALAVAAAVTPVPGGVGPMTIACLLHNALLAARQIHQRTGAG
jgi:methylenetetrahydrofolate dehydrogenase (NADP+)/methenyltetrahydrofolate cyclohydrolase